jgi:hypothetical protein
MVDLSKIDFTKLELPEFRGERVSISSNAIVHIRYAHIFGGLSFRERCGYWEIVSRGTIAELRQILDMCDTVDAFISAESERNRE